MSTVRRRMVLALALMLAVGLLPRGVVPAHAEDPDVNGAIAQQRQMQAELDRQRSQLTSLLADQATLVYLAFLVPMAFLAATDLEQRRLPHILLDPLIVASLLFVPFNPAVKPLEAAIGAAVALAFLGVTGLIVRGGIAIGDLYLVLPMGLILGWPAIFTAVFLGALLSALVGIGLLVTRRAGMRTYIPFGPFLVAGLVLALVWDPTLLGHMAAKPV